MTANTHSTVKIDHAITGFTDKTPTSRSYDFGDPFTHFYILPATPEGAQQLHWLMMTNDEDVNRQLISKAVKSGKFAQNLQFLVGLFPLVSQDRAYTALGFHLDAKILRTIEQKARENPDKSFCLLCFAWQADYYKKILPDNVRITAINAKMK